MGLAKRYFEKKEIILTDEEDKVLTSCVYRTFFTSLITAVGITTTLR
jgi:hypothetical protein